jgi:hypothetical protein
MEELDIEQSYQPRKGWEEAFEKMHKNGDDCLLIQDFFEEEDLISLNHICHYHP